MVSLPAVLGLHMLTTIVVAAVFVGAIYFNKGVAENFPDSEPVSTSNVF